MLWAREVVSSCPVPDLGDNVGQRRYWLGIWEFDKRGGWWFGLWFYCFAHERRVCRENVCYVGKSLTLEEVVSPGPRTAKHHKIQKIHIWLIYPHNLKSQGSIPQVCLIGNLSTSNQEPTDGDLGANCVETMSLPTIIPQRRNKGSVVSRATLPFISAQQERNTQQWGEKKPAERKHSDKRVGNSRIVLQTILSQDYHQWHMEGRKGGPAHKCQVGNFFQKCRQLF